MTSKPKQWLISDLGNVLISFDHFRGAQQLAALAGLSADKIFQWGFCSPLLAQFETGSVTPEELLANFNKTFSVDVTESDFRQAFSNIFTSRPEMEQLMARVKAQGAGLVLLSNTNEWHFEQCRKQFAFLSLFDHFVLSYEVGVMKPNPGIWDAVFNRIECQAASCCYVDDVPSYVDAATTCGIKSLLFTDTMSAETFFREQGLL